LLISTLMMVDPAYLRPNSKLFGVRLSEWRVRRKESQLSLALSAEISQRHLSFIESGRARPSRDMVLRLCDALDLPLRARNEMLICAGFAPVYPELPLDSADMASIREALSRIIGNHDPFPAFVVDRAWRVVMHNKAAWRLISLCIDEAAITSLSPDGMLNFMRMMFEPSQMRPRIENWHHIASRLLERLRREGSGDPESPSAALLAELAPSAGYDAHLYWQDDRLSPTVPLELRIGAQTLRLYNTITTFGTSQDVGVQEIRIEMSFPADDDTASFFREAADRV
jgi:transcriptional regulator with XRE-family HTH domain